MCWYCIKEKYVLRIFSSKFCSFGCRTVTACIRSFERWFLTRERERERERNSREPSCRLTHLQIPLTSSEKEKGSRKLLLISGRVCPVVNYPGDLVTTDRQSKEFTSRNWSRVSRKGANFPRKQPAQPTPLSTQEIESRSRGITLERKYV